MQIDENVPLAAFTTLRVGGAARFFARARNIAEVQAALAWATARAVPVFVFGGGTNVLAADEGFPGLVVQVANTDLEVRTDGTILVGAGVPMGRVVQEAAKQSLRGLEWAAGLPGTVGGATFGNAGAFGHETGELVREVTAIMPRGELRTYKSYHPMSLRGAEHSRALSARRRSNPAHGDRFASLAMTENELDEFRYRYRWSSFKEMPGVVIVSAVFQLCRGDPDAIRAAMSDAMTARRDHQPLADQSAGCIFKNPVVDIMNIRGVALGLASLDAARDMLGRQRPTEAKQLASVPAGKLIDECGLKGTRVGGAEVSPKHANFIVNTGAATARDIAELISFIKDRVREKTGIALEEEIRFLSST